MILDETKTTEQGTPATPSSDGKGGSTSKTDTESDSQKAINKAISDERAIAGREKKLLEKQLSEATKQSETLKAQLAEKDTALKEVQGKIETLEGELEEMSKDDPDRQKYLKKLKAMEGYEKELKDGRTKLDAELEAYKPDIEMGKEVRRSNLMGKIAGEFKGGDMDRLRALCDKAKVPDNEDEVRGIAEALWEKAEVQTTEEGEKKDPPHADSGDNKGGSDRIGDMSPKERAAEADKRLRTK